MLCAHSVRKEWKRERERNRLLNCGIIERVREIEGKEGHTHRLIKRYTVTNWGIHTRERTHRDKDRRNRKKKQCCHRGTHRKQAEPKRGRAWPKTYKLYIEYKDRGREHSRNAQEEEKEKRLGHCSQILLHRQENRVHSIQYRLTRETVYSQPVGRSLSLSPV